jgi:hypothetical protein
MHHHQHRDVSMTSWFIFPPLALCFLFSISTHCDSADFEFGGVLSCCAHFIFYYAVYVDYGLFSFVSLML